MDPANKKSDLTLPAKLIKRGGYKSFPVQQNLIWDWQVKANTFHFDLSFNILMNNKENEKTGTENDLTAFIHPDDIKSFNQYRETFKTSQQDKFQIEFRIHPDFGKEHWVIMQGETISQRKDGTPNRVMGTFFDITHYRKTYEFSSDHRMLLRLIDNLPGMAYRNTFKDGVWTHNYFSKGVKTLLGYDVEYYMEHEKELYKEQYTPEDYKRCWDEVNQAIKEKRSFQVFFRMKTASGEWKWVWEQGQPLYDNQGNIQAIEGFIADVTQQKELELKLHRENTRLQSSFQSHFHFGEIIGKSIPMQEIYSRIDKASASNANVLITGESGTGKELVTRMIHRLSMRGENDLVTVNCGAIPENLFESEFFGYKKGAFTGAQKDKQGYLATADGGTLFLDELGEIPKTFQVKLLRVLEGYGYIPVGDVKVHKPDFRVIAATNQNLEEMVKKGEFREDLFYRLYVFPINIPPLRERKEDIPLLVEHFLDKYNNETHDLLGAYELSLALKGYDWPGNVRELSNTVQRYVALGNIETLNSDLPLEIPRLEKNYSQSDLKNDGLKSVVESYEKDVIIKTLDANQWRRRKTANVLGITTRTLHRKMKQYQIKLSL